MREDKMIEDRLIIEEDSKKYGRSITHRRLVL
jgi:hypothetical protein